MLQSLQDLRTERRRERGFTLIELLVVVVIIGILIAIAIPVYLNYQKGAANKSAQSDTRNAIAVIEQCYADNANAYPGTAVAGTGNALNLNGCANGRLNYSPGNTLTYAKLGTTGYTVSTVAGSPGDKTYKYDSTTGQTATTP